MADPIKTDEAKSVAGGDASQVASDAEGNAEPRTQMQARRHAADHSVSPKSSTLANPDAELDADLSQDVLTANREAMVKDIRENGGGKMKGKQHELHQAVADAQQEVDAAITKRNRARDTYDRFVEANSVGAMSHADAVAAYMKADNASAEAAAKRQPVR